MRSADTLNMLVVGFALAWVGCLIELRQPAGFNRGRAVGVALFVVGEILLFGAGWWWGLIGLLVPPILINARRRTQP